MIKIQPIVNPVHLGACQQEKCALSSLELCLGFCVTVSLIGQLPILAKSYQYVEDRGFKDVVQKSLRYLPGQCSIRW